VALPSELYSPPSFPMLFYASGICPASSDEWFVRQAADPKTE